MCPDLLAIFSLIGFATISKNWLKKRPEEIVFFHVNVYESDSNAFNEFFWDSLYYSFAQNKQMADSYR